MLTHTLFYVTVSALNKVYIKGTSDDHYDVKIGIKDPFFQNCSLKDNSTDVPK